MTSSPKKDKEEDLKLPAKRKRSTSQSPDPPMKRRSTSSSPPRPEVDPSLSKPPSKERKRSSSPQLDKQLELKALEKILRYSKCPSDWNWNKFSRTNKIFAARNIMQFSNEWLESNPEKQAKEYYDLKTIHSLN